MHVEGRLGRACELGFHRHADREVGDEMAVHDVDVQPVGAGRFDIGHLGSKIEKIGGQDGR